MIDKVNIISHHVYNGRMRLWSPYLNYNKGINYILAANLLPIPTGKEIKVTSDPNYDVTNPRNIAQLLLIKDIYEHLLGEDNDKYTLISDLIELYVYKTLFRNSIADDALETIFKDFVPTNDQIIYLTHIHRILGLEEEIELSNEFTVNSLIESIDNKLAELLLVNISEELEPYRLNPRKYNNLILTKNDVLILALLLLDNPTEITILPGLPSADVILTNIINNHNLYLKDKKSNILREGYENFVSKMIWNISADPRNWIQGLISVDTSTGPWKDAANNTPLAKESLRYIGASVVGTFNLLTLTLEGKLNVGIIANSLKTLEAISHSIYKTLTFDTNEEILKLFFELKIHGKTINSVANAWVNSDKFATLDETTLQILLALDQDTDAFILLSSLLSLAVDNAKDPTLSKINGNLNMIGLYTTGIILGVSKEDLIDIINSPTGRLVSELMQGNIFNNKKGFSFFNEVIEYINKGPKVKKDEFPKKIGEKLVEKLYTAYEEGIQRLDLSDFMSALNSEIDKFSEDENKTAIVEDLKKLSKKLYNYSLLLSIITWDTYQTTIFKDGKEVTRHNKRWRDLYHLMKVNSELKQINKGTGLNQGLENSVEGLLQLLHDLSLILVLMNRNRSSDIDNDTANELKQSLGNTFVVDMVKFLSDEDYRNKVFNAADTLKRVTNPYKVFWDVVHYRGYIESLATVVEGSKLISNIYKATVTLYPQVISGFSLNKLEKQKMIKRIEEFYHRKRNKLFFEYLGKLFTFTYLKNGINIKGITLNSETNRKKFKTIVELEVLPLLQRMFKDNSFIQSLEPKINKRTVDHNVDVMIGSNISTRLETPADKMAFLQAKLDVYKLLKHDILGAPVVSILFAYNLIACDNLNVPNSLSPFFEDLRLTGLSSFIDIYDNFVKQPKTIDGNPISNLIDDEDLNELKQYCAPIRMYAGQDTKSDYIYLWDRKTKSYQLYQKFEEGIAPVTTTNSLFETPAKGMSINILGEDYTVIVTGNNVTIKDATNNIIDTYDALFKEAPITGIDDIIDLISKFNEPNEC